MMQPVLHDPTQFKDYHLHEYDACGIVSVIERKQIPTKANINLCIESLQKMEHRTGYTNGEGDGVGIHMDIPKALWKEKLGAQGSFVDRDDFTVGHIFINRQQSIPLIKNGIYQILDNLGFIFIFETDKVTKTSALGPLGKKEEPVFWQIALVSKESEVSLEKRLFDAILAMEAQEHIHVASFSNYHAVYKVMGDTTNLVSYYDDLTNPLIASSITLGHNRYSTNTRSTFFRVQPFSVLGHNGEINTITQLRQQAEMIGTKLPIGGSDSQDVNRTIETLLVNYQYSLFEAIELMFPPIINEIKAYSEEKQDLYAYLRRLWGPFAQGPAAIISRYKDEAVFSVDALGLRPLWKLETESSYVFASEQGVVLPSEYVADPKQLAPGEKIGFTRSATGEINIFYYEEFQTEVQKRLLKKIDAKDARKRLIPPPLPKPASFIESNAPEIYEYAAFGWDREHIQLLEQMADSGSEPIRSLGHDAPLAALDPERRNIADFLKESVAVVTNPAIDRDRETEHFSTRRILGERPPLIGRHEERNLLELPSPILLEGEEGYHLISATSSISYEQLLELEKTYTLSITYRENETIPAALNRLGAEAVKAVHDGNIFLILDDGKSHTEGNLWLDPHLAMASLQQVLVEHHLRRNCSVIIRSGALRSLHDIVTLIGLGADGVNPYLLFATVPLTFDLYTALNKGIEKVISTIGIHELRGYSRLFSAIGLHDEVANILNIPNFFGSTHVAFGFQHLYEDAVKRRNDFENKVGKTRRTYHIFPRIWKGIGDVAQGNGYDSFREKLAEIEKNNPVSIRHVTKIRQAQHPIEPRDITIKIGTHDLPFIISSMSFGSQNETAFRAYAEAAERLNMISLNGEGGEIKDMIGKYPNTRGQQIASGRFGVTSSLLHSSNLLEIKIGQGAKPGEGGHLPGSKVTKKIAEARNATIGSDLISPSNNHDIYSIEDLAQVISEIKTANEEAKVAVKVPVVPNIGTIAVGIVKAGADYITISGFDGGTGAARIHALTHVGLPVEIGIKAAHHALLEAGMREQVEIWADGGIRSASDALKIMLLGANRIGFGTLSMIAIGCTACRGCHLDTCHVGIATQIESVAQAKEHGLRRFVPRDFENAVQGLMNLFTAFGEELKRLTGQLGFANTQAIVGRSDLLVQEKGSDLLDLTALLRVSDIPYHSETREIPVLIPALSLDYEIEAESRKLQQIGPEQRNLGSRTAGYRTKEALLGKLESKPTSLVYKAGSIPGNGLGAYNTKHVNIHVQGGAQDGVGKTSLGGNIYITKALGKDGKFYSGSVGKGFGYGAQQGSLYIQGNADARAGIRLSGADIIVGGMITKAIPKEEHGNIGIHANIKGFAFEYMTNGRALVLGDPGPWICAGMTGGVVYVRHQPEMGLTEQALRRRIAKGAAVTLEHLSQSGTQDVLELLTDYLSVLRQQKQFEEALEIEVLLNDVASHFLQIIPTKEQADPTISTE